ncbi:SDR family oxidoreductase [Corallococcus sp. AB004]|uniref:SDR family oxidoreductase n=1 Tax=Corallococcus exiguus TaxID=83462 RepID=UPI000EA330FD|nr:SDR family oxidoreductase [Corallococcus exiguus]NPC73160.1 SDR family oxidoreductase [Corallococcus exiguus]NPD23740.1 SDR family oxidoreductase [Corallococcus exiguus]NRD47045.1 SDR family oxidoreductase [Corallococcus exiguus]RKI38101.1 SDR family oxidoreductase [Corallococcus sp. AB004]
MGTAFITGAGVRIGSAVARALGRAGYDLALHANRSMEPLEALAQELRELGRGVTLYSGDLSDAQAVDALGARVREAHPALDVVVHNAGLYERVDFAAVTREQYRRMLAVNVDAPFFLTQALLPSLRAGKDPLVVHLTDIGGERAVSHYAHYSVSKAGLVMLTRALAVELAPHVRVNAISPGVVAFPEHFDEAARKEVLDRVPMGREGSVEDVARTVVFLAREAPYLTGQVIAVDGGRSAQL